MVAGTQLLRLKSKFTKQAIESEVGHGPGSLDGAFPLNHFNLSCSSGFDDSDLGCIQQYSFFLSEELDNHYL